MMNLEDVEIKVDSNPRRVIMREQGGSSQISLISHRSAQLFPQELAMTLQLCPVALVDSKVHPTEEQNLLLLANEEVNEKLVNELTQILQRTIEIEKVRPEQWLSAYDKCYWKDWQNHQNEAELLSLKPPSKFDHEIKNISQMEEFTPFPEIMTEEATLVEALLLKDEGWKPVQLDPAAYYALEVNDEVELDKIQNSKTIKVVEVEKLTNSLQDTHQVTELKTSIPESFVTDQNSMNSVVSAIESITDTKNSVVDIEKLENEIASITVKSEAEILEEEIKNHIVALNSSDVSVVQNAKKELLKMDEQISLPLRVAFPGELRINPIASPQLLLDTKSLSGLMELLEERGESSLNIVAPYLKALDPQKNYAAMLLYLKFLRFEHLNLLKPFLLSKHPQLFQLCTYIFRVFTRFPQFSETLKENHAHLNSANSEETHQAAAMIGCFADLSAIPLLISRLNHQDEVLANICHQSLVSICLQDLPKIPQTWLQWWEHGRKQSRMKWLMDALKSETIHLRKLASIDLLFIANQDFGYEPLASEESREKALERVQQWWQKMLS